jgi:hypothetical protein
LVYPAMGARKKGVRGLMGPMFMEVL